jgi:hypothetical protein
MHDEHRHGLPDHGNPSEPDQRLQAQPAFAEFYAFVNDHLAERRANIWP